MLKLSGRRPRDLGVTAGQLKAPPGKPNCVSSQAAGGYARIDPLRFEGDAGAAMSRLAAIVAAQAGACIVTQRQDYLYAEFSTRLLGFVDDVEFWLDAGNQLFHVRSASRLGYSDMGVNRKRIERLREEFGKV